MRPQILHQMVHSRLARIVDKTVREPRQATHTADGDDLAARPAGFAALVAFDQQFEERHGSGEDGRDVGFQRVGPELLRAVVEVVVADFGCRGFGRGFGVGVGRGIEGRLPGVVD